MHPVVPDVPCRERDPRKANKEKASPTQIYTSHTHPTWSSPTMAPLQRCTYPYAFSSLRDAIFSQEVLRTQSLGQ